VISYLLFLWEGGCDHPRLLAHLSGFGVVYEAFILWKKPDEDMTDFYGAKMLESCFEALPFTALQTYVMALESDYNVILVLSLSFSLLASGLMTTTIVALDYDWSFTDKLVHVMIWTLDTIVRVCPLAYIVAEYNDYALKAGFIAGICLYNIIF